MFIRITPAPCQFSTVFLDAVMGTVVALDSQLFVEELAGQFGAFLHGTASMQYHGVSRRFTLLRDRPTVHQETEARKVWDSEVQKSHRQLGYWFDLIRGPADPLAT
jgi:hypothetical protein